MTVSRFQFPVFNSLLPSIPILQSFAFGYFDAVEVKLGGDFTLDQVDRSTFERMFFDHGREMHRIDPVSLSIHKSPKVHHFAFDRARVFHRDEVAHDLHSFTKVAFEFDSADALDALIFD